MITLKVDIDEETLVPMSKLAPATLRWLDEAADITSAKTIGEYI